MVLFWRISVLLVAAFLVWRIASSGISHYYLERLKDGDTGAAEKALAWDNRQPEARYREALRLSADNPEIARQLLETAYSQNPANTQPVLALARLEQAKGNQERSDALVERAAHMLPADPSIQREAADYWLARGRLDQAMLHWSKALEAQPALHDELFPIFLWIVEDTQSRSVFEAFASSPPSWWDGFFAEVSNRTVNVDAVRALFALRGSATESLITDVERRSYVKRLQKDGLITEAYLTWVNGLTEVERAHLGVLHNGGFELEPSNSGFDWHLGRLGDVVISTASTYGVEGDKALHLIFKRRDKPFSHLFQPLFLDPGAYRVTGMARTDSMHTRGGLQWVTQCTSSEVETLGESERFLGSSEWRDFSFEFQVPAGCPAQEIRLRSSGMRELEHQIDGGIWFDAMAMRKIPSLSAAATTEQDSASGSAIELQPNSAAEPSTREEAEQTEQQTRSHPASAEDDATE